MPQYPAFAAITEMNDNDVVLVYQDSSGVLKTILFSDLKSTIVAQSSASNGYANVVAFGAVGDGVADDTAEIQAAIDSFSDGDAEATTRGGVVYLPTGIYKITALTLKRGITLIGDGPEHTIIRRTPTTGNAISYDETDFAFAVTPGNLPNRCAIKELSLVQVGTPSAGRGISIAGKEGSFFQVFIENVVVKGAYDGIYLTKTSGSFLQNVIVDHAQVYGFFFTDTENLTAINCQSNLPGQSGSGVGFRVIGNRVNFISCVATLDGAYFGFDIGNSQSCGVYGCVSNGGFAGISIAGGSGNYINGFRQIVTADTVFGVYLSISNNNHLINITSSVVDDTNATYLVWADMPTYFNTLSVGYLEAPWPTATVNDKTAFDMILDSGNTSLNLPNVAGPAGSLWSNSGVVTVA